MNLDDIEVIECEKLDECFLRVDGRSCLACCEVYSLSDSGESFVIAELVGPTS